MRPAFALLSCAALVSMGVEAADAPAPPAAMDVLDLGETAEHAASRMPEVAAAPEPKKPANSPGYARSDYVPDDVLRDRGFSAVQTVQQQVGFGIGNDVGREGRDVARDLHDKHHDKGPDPAPGPGGGHDKGPGGGNGDGHHH